MNDKQNTDSFISYLAATAPALFQLIAVLSVGLVDVLKFKDFVLSPNFINIANFIVILLSISIISLAAFWDFNKFSLVKPGENPFDSTKKFWLSLKVFCLLAIIGFTIFIGIIMNKSIITTYIPQITFIQWLAYIISMVSISFIIYAFVLLKIQERNNKNFYENYIPRLLDSLRRYGHIKNPDIIILSVNRDNREAIVKLGGSSKFKVTTDYNGDMVTIEGIN